MEIYVAKVLNGLAVAKEYGVSEKAKYVMAPSGKLFRGFTQNILEVIPFGGVRFFPIDAKTQGVCEVPEDLLRGALAGDETLAAVQKKLSAFLKEVPAPKEVKADTNLPKEPDAENGDGKNNAKANGH